MSRTSRIEQAWSVAKPSIGCCATTSSRGKRFICNWQSLQERTASLQNNAQKRTPFLSTCARLATGYFVESWPPRHFLVGKRYGKVCWSLTFSLFHVGTIGPLRLLASTHAPREGPSQTIPGWDFWMIGSIFCWSSTQKSWTDLDFGRKPMEPTPFRVKHWVRGMMTITSNFDALPKFWPCDNLPGWQSGKPFVPFMNSAEGLATIELFGDSALVDKIQMLESSTAFSKT